MKKKLSSIVTIAGLLVSLSVLTIGCKNEVAASEHSKDTATNTKAKKIIFVGKEKACDCTRKTVDSGWAALQEALGKPAKLPVERLKIDTQAEKVEPYRKQQPIITLPAIYFVDSKGMVLQLLQGEVTVGQLRTAIEKNK